MKELRKNVLLALCVFMLLFLTGCDNTESKEKLPGTKWVIISIEENIDSSRAELLSQYFSEGLSFEFGNNGKVIVMNVESDYQIEGDKMYVSNGNQKEVYTFNIDGDYLYIDMTYVTLKLVKYEKYKETLTSIEEEDKETQEIGADDTEKQATQNTDLEVDIEEVPSGENETQGSDYASTAVTCMNGDVHVSFVECSEKYNTVVLRIDNNTDSEIRTFGLPNLVVDGKTVELNNFDNMRNSNVSIASNSYAEISYVVGSEFFQNGGRFDGSFHTMNMSYFNDMDYSIEIIRE